MWKSSLLQGSLAGFQAQVMDLLARLGKGGDKPIIVGGVIPADIEDAHPIIDFERSGLYQVSPAKFLSCREIH